MPMRRRLDLTPRQIGTTGNLSPRSPLFSVFYPPPPLPLPPAQKTETVVTSRQAGREARRSFFSGSVLLFVTVCGRVG